MSPSAAVHKEERPPPLSYFAREALLFGFTRTRASFAPAISVGVDGYGHNVMVIPGFLASDRTTSRLRRSLGKAGFNCAGWGLGRNLGIGADIFAQLDEQLSRLPSAGQLTLVGWSVGGLIAREYAKYAPDRVAKVITLGSPFSGNPRANNGWRMYELIAGHKVDAPPVSVTLSVKPPVPTFAIWSPRDGMVAAHAARGLADEADVQIQRNSTHMGLIADPGIIRQVAEIIVA